MQSNSELGSSDILQPIPLEEWPLLQKQLAADWPKYAYYYYWIENSIKWKKHNPNLALQIYCPQGQYQDDATFVGISSFSMWMVTVFTKDPFGKRLHEALIKTRRFDWSKGVTFSAVHEYIQPILFSALATLQTNQGIEIDFDVPGHFQIKSADECADVEVKVPEECYLGDLNESHLPVIHSVWPHADKKEPENSLTLLRLAVTVNRSLGLFLKEGNVLVSWALHNDWHGLGAVQTLDAYKRKGYAKVVVNALAKQLGKEGISPVLSVVRGNTPSENMFASLNWKLTIPATWSSNAVEDIFNDSLSQSLLPGEKTKKRDRTQTLYKRPGPPTPSKNGGRLSLQGNESRSSPNSRILRERNIKQRSTATPRRLKDLFGGSS